MSVKKYFFVGNDDSKSGVGRFVWNSFIKTTEENNYKTVVKVQVKSNFSRKIIDYFNFNLRILFLALNYSKSIIVHPQSIGFFQSSLIILFSKKTFYFTADSSYFCLRSYNFNPKNKLECVKCLKGIKFKDNECKPFPYNSKLIWIKFFYYVVEKFKTKIVFLVQNQKQLELIKLRYGEINYHITSMNPGDILENKFKNSINSLELLPKNKKNILFHASNHLEKGYGFMIDFAKKNKIFNVIIPSIKPENSLSIPNLFYIPCSWESGLLDLIIKCDIVMCPSIWSAPIEGALLKSLYWNGVVAVHKTDFAFSNEIYEKILHIDDSTSEFEILNFISKITKDDKESIKKFVLKKLNDFDLSIIK